MILLVIMIFVSGMIAGDVLGATRMKKKLDAETDEERLTRMRAEHLKSHGI